MKMDMVETYRERTNLVVEPRAPSNRQTPTTPGQLSSLHHLVPAPIKAQRVVSVTVVYEDAAACQWAREACEQMPLLAGSKGIVHTTWWNLNELSQPAVLAGAVSKAIRADVIVVAIRAMEGFPLPFCVWVSSWLPHRIKRKGTLVALIAIPKQSRSHSHSAADFLCDLARRAGMRFQIAERSLGGEAPNVTEEAFAEKRLAFASARSERLAARHRDAARRWRMAA